jgi:pyrroline-5-carboxylate reductase
MKKILFVGAGRITSSLLAGLALARYRGPIGVRPVMVHDHRLRTLRRIKKLYGVATEPDLQRALEWADILILAVRPASVVEVLREIAAVRKPSSSPLLAVSLAAGIPFTVLKRHLHSRVRWARAMPSPVSRSGHGLTALAFDRTFPTPARKELQGFFSLVGTTIVIPERQVDAFMVTYSSSHGYHALATLAEAAQNLGLDFKTAQLAAAHALGDAVLAWREGNLSLDALLREAVTPGGIAFAVLSAMDRAGYKKIIQRGLIAGVAQSKKNARLR